jgi:predicted alpha-1,6-mannanase (GH76 family)
MKKNRQYFTLIIIGLYVFSPIILNAQVQNQKADEAFAAFNDAFLVQKDGLTFYKTALNNNSKDYFWQQALDIFNVQDNYFRTGRDEDKQLMIELLDTFLEQNTQNWLWNEYNDDIFWGDLIFLRGYEYTGEPRFLRQGEYAFDLAYYHNENGGDWGWDDDLGGGLWWSRNKEAKETLSNGPGIVGACYLYQFTGESDYLVKAKKIYEWLRSTLRDNTTGEVWNKILADGTIYKSANIFNQGSFVGAANYLYQITGEKKYFDDAKKTADRVITHHSHDGVLASGTRNGTDLAEYFRWLGDFVRQNYLWNDYYSFFKMNSDAAWDIRRRDLDIAWNNFLEQHPEDLITTTNECNSSVVAHEMTPVLQSIANIIQAEDYNFKSGIDVEPTSSGGKCVASIENGDWIEYILDIPSSGFYNFNCSVAAINESSALLQLNGITIDEINFPATGSIQTYTNTSSEVYLTAGIQSIKLIAQNEGWNIDNWTATMTEPASPGKIQAENFTEMDGIQVENTFDVGGGKNVGYIEANDWMEYSINVPESGKYVLNFRMAGKNPGTLLIQQSGETLETVAIPATGGWQNWITVEGISVDLSEGTQTIRILAQTSGWNINWWSAELESNVPTTISTPKVDKLETTNVLSIYPNPVSTDLTIDCGKEWFSDIVIFDIDGKIVLNESGIIQGSTSINVENLPEGVFFLTIQTTKNGRLVKKFIR